jgi:hypothetical protein
MILIKISIFFICLIWQYSILFSNPGKINLISNYSRLIQENDDLIIKGIQSISISPNGKLLSLIDRSRLFVALYNVENGKLLASFWTNDTLSNYFINK